MAQNLINNDFNIALVRLLYELIEVVELAKNWNLIDKDLCSFQKKKTV